MRVLAFSDFAPPDSEGGVEHAIDEIYTRVVERERIQIDLVSLADASASPVERRSGLTIHRARRLPLEHWTGMQTAISPAVWSLGARIARQVAPDIVHGHTLFFHTSMVAATVARCLRVPLLLTAHVGSLAALPQPQRAAAQLYEQTIGRALARSARRVICVSRDVAEHVGRLGVDSTQIVVIPNGVDLDRFRPARRRSGKRPVIVCVGRLIMNKGQHALLAAAEQLWAEGADFETIFVGDGPQRAQLEREAARRGLEHMVAFIGEQARVDEILREADIFVRPSLTEGMSLAVLEAMATGLPVVVTDASGTRDLVTHGVNGVIVRRGDPAGLHASLRWLLHDEQARSRLGAAARRRAEEFSWDRAAEATLKEFHRAAS